MNFDVVIDQKARYVRVALTGSPSIGQMLSMIHLLGVESETWKQTATLVDLRGVVTEYSQLEQFRIGEEAASSLSHMDKIASVVPTYSEVTTVARGASFCATTMGAAAGSSWTSRDTCSRSCAAR